MKKTLAAVAVLGAFAGSAIAADVTLYGVVDMGLNYTHIDMDRADMDDVDSFTMESGQQSGSRWGLKGTEDLGNGLTVGFVLENGFTVDDGNDNGTMFDRESMLFLEGGFGKLAFGRIGSFNQGQGSFSKIGMLTPFGTSWSGYVAEAGDVFSTSTRYNNSIVYQTPTFAGFQVTAMYSMGNSVSDADEDDYQVENESSTNRYYGIAATYNNGPFGAYLAVDSINYRSWNGDAPTGNDPDDSLTVTLGGNYDFEVAKVYLGAQYFDEALLSSLGGIAGRDGYDDMFGLDTGDVKSMKVTGYSVLLGADAPVAGGKLMGAVAYVDAEQSDWQEDQGREFDFTRWVVSLGYTYPLSKRTNLYGVASYMDDEIEGKGNDNGKDWNPSAYTLMIGMKHTF